MKKIAVIGTGIMGSGIVMNFLKNGYDVFVWNRSKDKLKGLIENGAKPAETPKEAAQMADIVFEVTANDESSKAVWTGTEGILAGSDSKKMLIANGTFTISWIDELSELCKQQDFNFFDIPMTGGRMGAETGKLILLVGGDEQRLHEIENDLKAISTEIIYFGKVGSGIRYKLVLNMMQAIHITALGEALGLARELKLDIDKVGNALCERPGGVITNLAWKGYKEEPEPINFSIEWIMKDLTYAKNAAEDISTPFLDDVMQKYKDAIAKGLEQKDWTYVNKMNQ